jgi:hypothetical protein
MARKSKQYDAGMTTQPSSSNLAESRSFEQASAAASSHEPLAQRHALADLSDIELLAQLSSLVRQEQGLTVAILVHLAEVVRRGLHLAKGCPSLFAYCVQRLRLSEDVAYKRVGGARYGRRFPLALELLSQGALHLSTLMLVGPHLTEANHREWLSAVSGKSKRETELWVAMRCPKPDVPSSVRRLPPRQALTQPVANADAAAPLAGQAANALDRPRVQPLSGSTFRVVFTASEGLKQKLDRARELCSHSVAPGDLPALFERALDLLIEREEKRRCAVRSPRCEKSTQNREIRTARPLVVGSNEDPDPVGVAEPEERLLDPDASAELAVRRQRGQEHLERASVSEFSRHVPASESEFSRHVPAMVRRVVWERDGGQCTFVDDEGRRCTARDFLEIDHVDPHARGGLTAIRNCRLLCRAHNQYHAIRTFGTDFIERARSRKATG